MTDDIYDVLDDILYSDKSSEELKKLHQLDDLSGTNVLVGQADVLDELLIRGEKIGPVSLYDLSALVEDVVLNPSLRISDCDELQFFYAYNDAFGLSILSEMDEHPAEALCRFYTDKMNIKRDSSEATYQYLQRCTVITDVGKAKSTTMKAVQNLRDLLEAADQLGLVCRPTLIYDFPLLYARRAGTFEYLYGIIEEEFRKNIEYFSTFQDKKTFYFPPLLAILLSRCKSPEDIPSIMLEMRDEFRVAREKFALLALHFREVQNFRDALTLRDEFVETRHRLGELLKQRSSINLISDILVSGMIGLSPAAVVFAVIPRFIAWIKRRLTSKKYGFEVFESIFEEAMSTTSYSTLLEKVFHNRIDTEEFKAFSGKASVINIT